MATKLPTWTCDNCNYIQDFEPTQENMDVHHPGTPANTCPSCGQATLTPENDPRKQVTSTE